MENFFGKNLHFLRKAKGLNLIETGKILGVGKSMVSNYENFKNEPSLDAVISAAKYFGLSTDDLLTTDLSTKTGNSSVKSEKSSQEEYKQLSRRIDEMVEELLKIKQSMGNGPVVHLSDLKYIEGTFQDKPMAKPVKRK